MYYGRDEAEHVIVRIVVKDGKIVSAEIVTPKDFDADHAEGILAAVVSSQTVERADSDTADDSTLKSALKVALNRALLGDTLTAEVRKAIIKHRNGRSAACLCGSRE